jgi:hypothetical protein
MTHVPFLGVDHPAETERLSGRTVDGSVTYIKVIKKAGAAGTGEVDIAHGITNLGRILYIYGGCSLNGGQRLPIPYPGSGLTDGISLRGFGTTNNIRLSIGSTWTSTLAVEDVWLVLEYYKTA